MKSALSSIMAAALAVVGISCGSSGSGPPDAALPPGGSPAAASQPGGSPAASPQAVSLAGTWSGTGVDSNANTGPNGATTVTWTLAQTDANVSGTVTTQSVDPPNTTCTSCHRNKTGTLAGTIAGTTLTLTMSFPAGNPAGNPADVTPICSATLTGTVSAITQSSLTASYSGADTCEGALLNGTLVMARML